MDHLLLVFLIAALLLEGRAQWERRRLNRVGEALLNDCLQTLYVTNSSLYKQEPFRISPEKRYFQAVRSRPHGRLHFTVSASTPRDTEWLIEMVRGISLEFVDRDANKAIYVTIHPVRRSNVVKPGA